MVYTFHSPWDRAQTCAVICATVRKMGGNVKETSPGCITAKWRSPQYITVLPTEFKFYVGDGMVRAVTGNGTMQLIPMRFKVRGGFPSVWNWFIVNLLQLWPNVDFGLRPGDAELVAVQFVGGETEDVFVSNTVHAPSFGGAVLGGLLFGVPGAVIGSSYGTSYTRGKMSTKFSNAVLVKARYSNGLLAEGELQKNSPVYNEILVNMSHYSMDVK